MRQQGSQALEQAHERPGYSNPSTVLAAVNTACAPRAAVASGQC